MSTGILGQQPNAPATGMIRRHGYINTSSEAGRPTVIDFKPTDVVAARCWSNSFGNPSYTFLFHDGTVLFTVDDYGGMNGIRHISADVVDRKKDLFRWWL